MTNKKLQLVKITQYEYILNINIYPEKTFFSRPNQMIRVVLYASD